MPTRATDTGVGPAARQVAEHASALARLEVQLAMLELRTKIKRLGVGIALGVVAGILLLFAFGYGFASVAAAIAIALPWWASLAIVFGGLFTLALLLGLGALIAVRKATPPVPEQAIDEAKQTTAVLARTDGGT